MNFAAAHRSQAQEYEYILIEYSKWLSSRTNRYDLKNRKYEIDERDIEDEVWQLHGCAL